MNLISKENAAGGSRIAAVGMWDGVHRGHRFLIDYVRIEGLYRGLTPAVITFSNHPLSVVRPDDAPALLTSTSSRLSRLEAAGVEDCIMIDFDETIRRKSAREFLEMLKRDYNVATLVVGFNNRFGHDRVDGIEQYREIASKIGMTVLEAPEYTGDHSPISSSIIRKLLRDGDVAEAARRLGYLYEIKGEVVDGAHIGRTLGFPTANIVPVEENILIPCPGVYAVLVTTPDGVERAGMVNIGCRPTVATGNPADMTIEVHILDFNGFLYQEELTLKFVERLRGEKKFSSLKKLASALEADAVKVRKLLGLPR